MEDEAPCPWNLDGRHALLGLGLAFSVVTLDAPVRLGLVFGDYPDPHHAGHLKGAFVSTPELLLKTMLAIAALTAATWLWRRLRKLDAMSAI